MKNKKTTYRLIFLRDFGLFALSILLGLILFIIIGSIVMVSISFPTIKTVDNETLTNVINGDYDQFEYQKYLGSSGEYIVIIDDEIVYTSDEHLYQFDKTLLTLMPLETNDLYIERTSYFDTNDNLLYELSVYSDLGVEKIVVKDDGTVVFKTDDFILNHYSGEALEYIKGNIYQGLYLTRVDFDNNHIILLREEKDVYNVKLQYLIIFTLILSFIFIILVPLFIFTIKLDKSIKKPLVMLTSALKGYQNVNHYQPLCIDGPKEISDVCQSFNEMAGKLSQSEQEKQKMLSDISHDLKTPVTIIEGYAKALLDNKISAENQKDILQIIVSRSMSLTKLINTLNEYNKMERSDFKLTLKEVDFNEFIRCYFIEKYDEIELNGFTLDSNINEQKVNVLLDTFNFVRVLDNLLSNTYKYSSSGKNIFVKTEIIDDDVVLSFGDDGIGIDEQLKDDIFKPFVMKEKARQNNSSGLGLAIVKRIIDLHHGSITLTNDSKYKTIFVIKIPLIK